MPHRTKPNLLVVLPTGCIGGAELGTRDLLASISEFNITLLTQEALTPLFAPLGIALYTFEQHSCTAYYDIRPANMLRYGKAVAQISRRSAADIIFAVTHSGTIAASLAQLWRRTPVVGTMLTHLSGHFQRIGIPPSTMERFWIRTCLGFLPKGMIVPSQGVATDLSENFGLTPSKIRVIPNGIHHALVRQLAQAKAALKKEVPWVVSACRLEPEKDFDTLLHAFALVRQELPAQLLILGEGALHESICAKAKKLGIAADVTLLGFQNNPFAWISRAELFVLSSHHEGFGNVIVEAMALGIPVVASDCPSGPRAIIQDKKNGFLVPTQNPQAMAQAISQLLKKPLLRKTLAHSATARAEFFSVERMTRAYQYYFHQLLSKS